MDVTLFFILVLITIIAQVLIAIAVIFYKTGIRPSISILKSAWKLHKTLNEAGITSIIPSRRYYRASRRKASISEYISQAKHSLIITGISLTTGLPFEDLGEKFKELIKRNANITISLVNPNLISCIDSICSSLNKDRGVLVNEISSALIELWGLRESLGKEDKKRLHLKVHNTVPFASAILIDVNVANYSGTIQLETKSYKAPFDKSWAIELREKKGSKNVLYRTMKKSWLKLISDAEDFNPSIHLPQKRKRDKNGGK